MGALEEVDWPPRALATERLVLRETRAEDRAGHLELLTSEDVRRYLGGPLPRDELVRTMPELPGRYPGIFAIELGGLFIGAVMLERRTVRRPGHVRDEGDELEISFTLLPAYWGRGYASEAAEAVLAWADAVFPDEPVLRCTQAANARARRLADRLGFRHVATLNEFGTEQWLGVRGGAFVPFGDPCG
jgi:RimJ/RimL family protein N-acetyltransferase